MPPVLQALLEQDAYLRQIEADGMAEDVYGKGLWHDAVFEGLTETCRLDVELIVPEPQFAVEAKATNGSKLFINVCSCPKVIST